MTKRNPLETPLSFWGAFRKEREIKENVPLNQDEKTMAFYTLCKNWRALIRAATENPVEFLNEGEQPPEVLSSFVQVKLCTHMHAELEGFKNTYKAQLEQDADFNDNISQAWRFYDLKGELALGIERSPSDVMQQLHYFVQSPFSWIKNEAEELHDCIPSIKEENGFITGYAAQLTKLIEARSKRLDVENDIQYSPPSP